MIKPLTEIPMNESQKRQSYRRMIRDDIQSAINKGIDKFEFDGDYNWKYLAQYAREEADNIWRSTWNDIMRKAKKENNLDKIHMRYPSYQDKGKYIKISSVKMPDRIHVYCQIYFDIPQKICGECIREAIAEKEEREKQKIYAKSGDLSIDIEKLDLSVRSFNCLRRAGYKTIGDLSGKTMDDLARVRNLGKRGCEEILQKMKEYGVNTGDDL